MEKQKEIVYVTDPDTSNTIINDSKGQKCYGRKNIIIGVTPEEFIKDPFEIIKDNMAKILSTHKQNVNEMNYLNEVMRGKYDILKKVRANGDNKINNKHITNYAWEFVNFKKGYYIGKNVKYVDVDEEKGEDIKYFNRYIRDSDKSSKDLIKYENMFITGIAYSMTIPQKRDVDLEHESPFIYEILHNEDVCVVRSNDIFRTKLFTMCISQVNKPNDNYYEYTIYYDNVYLVIRDNGDGNYILFDQGVMPVKECITEYQLNEQRMGVFEVVLSSLNTMNTMTSNVLDQQEENVNNYLTFENVDVSQVIKNAKEFRAKRILAVNTVRPETPAKIGSISADVNLSPINEKYEKIEQRTYDIVGVPMPTSNTGQGVSGEAQEKGGGWENAQNIALVDTTYISKFEKEDLNKFLYISRETPNSKTTNLYTSSIEIKYTINKSNNMQVKAQSLKYYLDSGFTREQALTFCEVTDDPQNEGRIADENYKAQQKEKMNYDVELAKKQSEARGVNKTTEENIIVEK